MAGVSSWRGLGRKPVGEIPGEEGGYDRPLTAEQQGAPRRRRVHAWEINQQREELFRQKELGLLSQILASVGGVYSALTDPPIDDVLFSGSVQIGPPGAPNAFRQLDFKQATAFVAIFNYQDVPLYLMEGGYAGGDSGVPGFGAGRFQIQPFEARGVPMRGNAITVWIATAPAAGPTCDLAVYARPQGAFSAAIRV